MNESDLLLHIKSSLRQAGDSQWARYPLPTDFPAFRSSGQAARNALGLFEGPWLVMRDPCLRVMREAVLLAGRTLVIPTLGARDLTSVESSSLRDTGTSAVLGITRIPAGSRYRGEVGVVVVACHAFDPMKRRVYGLDTCRTERFLQDLYEDGLCDGYKLNPQVPVVVLASDAQQVSGWGDQWLAHPADLVVTSTRIIRLGTGEQELFSGSPDSLTVFPGSAGLQAPSGDSPGITTAQTGFDSP